MKIKFFKLIIFIVLTMSFSISYAQMKNATADSTSDIIPPTNPGAIVLMQQGYINWPANPNSEQQNFNTSQICPVNFTPYVLISMSKAAYSSNDFLQGFGACVNGLAKQGNSYRVNYLVSRKFATASNRSNSGLYVGTDDGAWTVWSTTDMPPTTSMSNTKNDYAQLGGFYWALYCYPPNFKPPLNETSTSLTDPSSPYNNGCRGGETTATNPY